LLAGVLTHFQQQYPDIEVALFEGTLQEIQEWINICFLKLHPRRRGARAALEAR
jgi:hypothetical protein